MLQEIKAFFKRKAGISQRKKGESYFPVRAALNLPDHARYDLEEIAIFYAEYERKIGHKLKDGDRIRFTEFGNGGIWLTNDYCAFDDLKEKMHIIPPKKKTISQIPGSP